MPGGRRLYLHVNQLCTECKWETQCMWLQSTSLAHCSSSPKAISTSLLHIVDGDAGSRKITWRIRWSCSFFLQDNQSKLAVWKSSGIWDMLRRRHYENYNLSLFTTLKHVGILQLHPDQFVVSSHSGLPSWLGGASLSIWQLTSHLCSSYI